MAATGAMVGPPAPDLRWAASSVMPKNGVSSAPEYVVGMAIWATTGRSRYEAPGRPARCSVKKHTALPRSAHEPPPKETMASTSDASACCRASWTAVVGTCDRTPSKTATNRRPSRSTSRCPAGDCRRPVVVTSMTRRPPASFTTSSTPSMASRPKMIRCAYPVCVQPISRRGCRTRWCPPAPPGG